MVPIRTRSFHSIDPGLCTSYWESQNGELYAYMDGKFHTCTEAGEPIVPVRFSYSIRVPEQIDFGHLYRGFIPDLQVEDEPLESTIRYPLNAIVSRAIPSWIKKAPVGGSA